MSAVVIHARRPCIDAAHQDDGDNGSGRSPQDFQCKLGDSQGYGDDMDTDVPGLWHHRFSDGKAVHVVILTEY